MKTLIDTLKYLLLVRKLSLEREAKNFLNNPYVRELSIVDKLEKRLKRLEQFINYILLPSLGFVVGFIIVAWLLKRFLH